MVEWSCTKERLNERGPYIFVEWSCGNKRNKSLWKLNSGQMVVHIASAKIPDCEERTYPPFKHLLWAIPRLIVTRFQFYLPSGWDLLKRNEGMGSTSSPAHLFVIRRRRKRGLENCSMDKGGHGVSTRFYLIVLVFGVNQEN